MRFLAFIVAMVTAGSSHASNKILPTEFWGAFCA